MIHEHQGNLLHRERGILVHGCNAQGIMGAGIARVIKERHPTVFAAYRMRKESGGLHLGDIIPVEVDSATPPKIIISAITQEHFGTDKRVVYVDYAAIEACFTKIRPLAIELALPVHFPLIGCGLANGKWEEVGPRIDHALGDDVEKHLWMLHAA